MSLAAPTPTGQMDSEYNLARWNITWLHTDSRANFSGQLMVKFELQVALNSQIGPPGPAPAAPPRRCQCAASGLARGLGVIQPGRAASLNSQLGPPAQSGSGGAPSH